MKTNQIHPWIKRTMIRLNSNESENEGNIQINKKKKENEKRSRKKKGGKKTINQSPQQNIYFM